MVTLRLAEHGVGGERIHNTRLGVVYQEEDLGALHEYVKATILGRKRDLLTTAQTFRIGFHSSGLIRKLAHLEESHEGQKDS